MTIAKTQLAPDATISTVTPTLLRPENYVRTVLANMMPCKRENGNAAVRIGITGEGKVPYHKITYTAEDGSELFYKAYDGERTIEGVKIRENTWSAAATSIDDVQKLLGEIRGFKGKR